jgi:hypothetical protein
MNLTTHMPVECPLPSPVERDIFRTVIPTKPSAKDIHPRLLFFCHFPHRLTVLKQTSMPSKLLLQPASCLPRLQGQLDAVALASREKPLLSEIEQLSSSTGKIESVVQGLKHELFSNNKILSLPRKWQPLSKYKSWRNSKYS